MEVYQMVRWNRAFNVEIFIFANAQDFLMASKIVNWNLYRGKNLPQQSHDLRSIHEYIFKFFQSTLYPNEPQTHVAILPNIKSMVLFQWVTTSPERLFQEYEAGRVSEL